MKNGAAKSCWGNYGEGGGDGGVDGDAEEKIENGDEDYASADTEKGGEEASEKA